MDITSARGDVPQSGRFQRPPSPHRRRTVQQDSDSALDSDYAVGVRQGSALGETAEAWPPPHPLFAWGDDGVDGRLGRMRHRMSKPFESAARSEVWKADTPLGAR